MTMDAILEVKDLKKNFDTPRGQLHAVDGISFSLKPGQTLGVVGESGCGKSTLGRTVLGLTPATDGSICYNGVDVTRARGSQRRQLRREMQIIFQDPSSSLDPRKNVRDLIAEPLKIHHACKNRAALNQRVSELMEIVGLADRFAQSYPHELDGGRRQRIGVARALALNPQFIVCDEPVSALDVSIQAQILNLLKELQLQRNLAFMFITHDMSVVKHISHEIMVMYMGTMVEKCPAKALFQAPLHPYTVGLLSAIPVPSIHQKKNRIIMQGEITSPVNPKPGCRFAARCPHATELCHTQIPPVEEVLPEHYVACHRVHEINDISALTEKIHA